MRHTPGFQFPSAPVLSGSQDGGMLAKDLQALQQYAAALDSVLRRFSDNIYHDLGTGRSRHQVFSAAPTSADLDVGEMAILQSTATDRLYTRVIANSTAEVIKFVPLSTFPAGGGGVTSSEILYSGQISGLIPDFVTSSEILYSGQISGLIPPCTGGGGLGMINSSYVGDGEIGKYISFGSSYGPRYVVIKKYTDNNVVGHVGMRVSDSATTWSWQEGRSVMATNVFDIQASGINVHNPLNTNAKLYLFTALYPTV